MAGYLGNIPTPQATQTRDTFTATSGQTSFATSGYTVGMLDVYLNGVKLSAADITATNGSDVVLASGASADDIVEVVSFSTFDSASGAFSVDLKSDKLLNKSGDQDSGIDLSTNDVVKVNIAGSEKVRVDASGNVGIGNTTPSSFYSLADNLVAGTGTGGHGVTIYSGNDSSGYIAFNDTASASMQGFIQYNHDGNYLAFGTNGFDRGRFDSSGNFLQGCTSTPSSSVHGNMLRNVLSVGASVFSVGNYSSSVEMIQFVNANGNVGSIDTSGSGTSYNTSSDYRLKENVVTDWDATSRLKQLKPSRFNFKADKDTTLDGFLAHEVSSVVPEAVTGTKDEIEVWKERDELPNGVSVGDNKLDDDGNTIPIPQGIDQSKLVPLLVKTIQELEARITVLEAK